MGELKTLVLDADARTKYLIQNRARLNRLDRIEKDARQQRQFVAVVPFHQGSANPKEFITEKLPSLKSSRYNPGDDPRLRQRVRPILKRERIPIIVDSESPLQLRFGAIIH